MLVLGVCFQSRRRARALVAGLPRQNHVYSTIDQLFRFKNNESDEMPCKLDSTENRRSFEKYPTISTGLRGDRKPDGDKKERIPAWTRVATLKEFLCMCTLEVRMLDNASRLSGNLLSAQGNWAFAPETRRPNPE